MFASGETLLQNKIILICTGVTLALVSHGGTASMGSHHPTLRRSLLLLNPNPSQHRNQSPLIALRLLWGRRGWIGTDRL